MLTTGPMLDALLMPLPIAVALVGAGLLARGFGRQRAAFIALACGCGIAFASTLGPVANGALHPLEKRYPAILDATDLATSPRYIAVLGSGYNPRDGLPVTAALDAVGVVRLTEGLRLYRQLPKSVLIVSGGAAGGHPPTAEGYARAAIALGVPAQVIMVLDTPINTAAEIRLLHERLGSAPVLLVTSAAHMPRAMALCERIGLRAIAAPTGQMARAPSVLSLSTWLPSAEHLRMTETAMHEYLGLFALSLGLT